MQAFDDFSDTDLQWLNQAIHTHGGLCAAAVFDALKRALSLQAEPAMIDALRCVEPSVSGSAAQSAQVGAAAMLGLVAGRSGAGGASADELGARWQRLCGEISAAQAGGNTESLAREIYRRALEFCRALLPQAEPAPDAEKPRQYYEGIYADREAMFQHSPFALEEKLSKAVMQGDESLAFAALREIRARGEKAVVARNPLRSAKNSIIGSVAFLARAAIQAGVGANDAFALSDALIQKTEDLADREQVLAFEENILGQYIRLVRRRLEETYSPVVLRAIHYVENRLGSRVGLEQAAQYAGVHPGYLSGRFRREVGLPFSQYVSKRRIQESCYFVRHTMYTIAEISELYGFSSESYYIQRFKLVFGVTPTEYRRRGLSE